MTGIQLLAKAENWSVLQVIWLATIPLSVTTDATIAVCQPQQCAIQMYLFVKCLHNSCDGGTLNINFSNNNNTTKKIQDLIFICRGYSICIQTLSGINIINLSRTMFNNNICLEKNVPSTNITTIPTASATAKTSSATSYNAQLSDRIHCVKMTFIIAKKSCTLFNNICLKFV